MSEPKSPIDQALDLLVYAPLGLLLSARQALPELADKGRQTFESQTSLARMFGQLAVKQARGRVEERLRPFTEPAAPPDTGPAAEPAPAPSGSPPAPAEAAAPPEAPPATDVPSPAGGATGAVDANGSLDDDDLAIPGYDALSASQVVQRLAGLTPAELEAVRAYEAATRGRKTILSRIDQLQQMP